MELAKDVFGISGHRVDASDFMCGIYAHTYPIYTHKMYDINVHFGGNVCL